MASDRIDASEVHKKCSRFCLFFIKKGGVTNTRVGIIGGYGRVGLEAAKCFLETTGYDIIIGGRDKKMGEATVESMGPRASGRVVDVYNQHSLDSFCRKCDIVIN
jgi:saccharopine dehydrogenase-like NADP-dependent oxidoreductase